VADRKISRSTIVMMLGITATAGWLAFTFWNTWTGGHISVGQICLVHVGKSERTIPTVCVMAHDRDSAQPGAIDIVLSRDHLLQFSKSIDEHIHERPQSARSDFGTYQIHDPMHSRRNGRTLSNEEMRAVLRRLMQLTESPSKSIEMDRLAGVVMALELNSASR
jgi:hypothetical protein